MSTIIIQDQDLNAEGYKTLRGKGFTTSTLNRILQNEKYIGVYEYKDIRVEDGIPALVSKELFEKCQRMMYRRHIAPAAARERTFLLTSKLFCGKCGELMTGDGGTSRSGQVYSYYTCNGRKRRKCDKDRVGKDWIEQLVISELMRILSADGFIEALADKVVDFQARNKDDSALRALEARQKEVDRAVNNLMAAIEQGIITPTTKSRMVELEAEQEKLTKAIAKEVIKEPEIERDQVIWFLERFRDGDINDEVFRSFLVDTFINSIYLYDDDKMVLILNYSGDNSKITLQSVEKNVLQGNAECSAFEESTAPSEDNPNLLPVGDGFGFVFFYAYPNFNSKIDRYRH